MGCLKCISVGLGSCLISVVALAVKPPEPIYGQIGTLVNVYATLNVCLDSIARVPVDRSTANYYLKFFDFQLRITQIVENGSSRYSGSHVGIVIIAARQLTDSTEFQQKFSSVYSEKCSEQILHDAGVAIDDAELIINSALKRTVK